MTVPARTRPADAAGRHHGIEPPRGLEDVPHSSLRQGFFGRMFRTLPPLEASVPDLLELACSTFEAEGIDEENDEFNNPDIPAGYTYVGQFIDHDVTFDPTSRLQRRNDPDALTNFRTPRLDLDSLYGAGPHDAPYLYEPDGVRLRLVNRQVDWELPREAPDGSDRPLRALIGDPRNDENTIVSQLHIAFSRFHNAVIDACEACIPASRLFDTCQQIVRWHYQWMIVHDFLPKIVGQDIVDDVLGLQKFATPTSRDNRGQSVRDKQQAMSAIFKPNFRFFTWENLPFMPVEFAVAAYRFGHSMVRSDYALNPETDGENPDGTSREIVLFSNGEGTQTLAGFRERPPELTIDWSFFFPMPNLEGREPQPSRNIDTRLSFSLSLIPGGPTRESDPTLSLPLRLDVDAVLAAARLEFGDALRPLPNVERFEHVNRKIGQLLPVRNLARGEALGLPSGQDVARAMGVPPHLILDRESFAYLDESLRNAFGNATPLWYYILREAELLNDGKCLGPVGGRIVAEVLIGLLWGDRLSYLRSSPAWQPTPDWFGAVDGGNGKPIFGMPELLAFAGSQQPSDLTLEQVAQQRGHQSLGLVGSSFQPPKEDTVTFGPLKEISDSISFELDQSNWGNVSDMEPLSTKYGSNAKFFMYRYEIPPLTGLSKKARKGTVIYFVEHVPAGSALVFERGNENFTYADDPKTPPAPFAGQVRIYPEVGLPVPQSELVPGKTYNLQAGDTLFVSDATYSVMLFGAGNQPAIVTAAGIMVASGADPCSGHPC